MRRVAAIDCGTNSMRLLVADVDTRGIDEHAGLHEVARVMEVVRLGEGLHRTGVISHAALGRAGATAGRFAQQCTELGVEQVRCAATAATRAAGNAARFADVMECAFARWGARLEVISGREEATLSFQGATSVLALQYMGPFAVVDIGGGSTEVVRGTSAVERAVSVSVGCVTLCEQLEVVDALDAMVWEQVGACTRDALLGAPFDGVNTLVGVAGTATTVACHVLRLSEYSAAAIQSAVFSPAQVVQGCRELAAMSVEQRLQWGFMHPGRADVIGVGAAMWAAVVEDVAARNPRVQVVVSERDILDGLVLSLAGQRDRGLTLGPQST